MHPLSIFPFLLNFQLLAPTLLRLTVGILLMFSGVKRYKHHKTLGVLNILSSIFIIIGLYTQAAALFAIVLAIIDYRANKKMYILMIAIFISLLFTGPGFLAFDLPL